MVIGGASKKRHNGIVPIRPSDARLLRDLDKFMSLEDKEKVSDLFPIKVVAHVPSGKRLIGILKDSSHVYLLGVSRY